jgi:uncharacterized protein YndB with AHSA1/START domain/DNA-binding transcriptional ArsR family regulator
MDAVFKALADASRRRLLDGLNDRNGQTLRELCAGLAMTRQSVSKHLAVLEEAGLVTTVWRGREKLHYLDAAPINAITDRWIRHYDRGRAQALADLRTALEAEPMSGEFVYTTYIQTTPERLWQALTDPAFTERYWGVGFDTDWRPGSPMAWREGGVTMAGDEQVVVEADPYTRLVYTWHSFTPAWARVHGFDDEFLAKATSERRTTASFTLEPQPSGAVKLTVVHGGFEPGSVVLPEISQGWPALLSSLKTLLETGEPLPA